MAISCVVIIPTRNRAALAKNAICSVLSHQGDDLQLIVSDNSTSTEEKRDLSSFCANFADSRLKYITPPQPLAMPLHWEFAVNQAKAMAHATHFVILTDRMVFRQGMLRVVLDAVSTQPDQVLSYNDDMLHDRTTPLQLERKKLTGQILDLDAGHLLYLSSIGVFPQALPRMLNCVVPRKLLDKIQERFGDVYSSVAPDLCHAYRCLAICDSIRYYDAPVMIQYGFAKSNGTGYYDKKTNDAWADFNRNAGSRGLTYAAPIPEICCNLNVVYHEYCFVWKQAQDEAKYPAVDWRRYVQAIAQDIELCGNPEVRAQLLAILRKHAGNELDSATPAPPPLQTRRRMGLKDYWNRLSRASWTKPIWLVLARLRVQPPADNRFTFKDVESAMYYSNRVKPYYVPTADHVQYMQRGWKLAG